MIVTYVPETYELEGDDAAETIEQVDRWELIKDSAIRFRYADGFTYARAVGFQAVLTLIPATIVAIAAAVLIGDTGLQDALRGLIQSVMPGEASGVLLNAFDQAEQSAQGEILAIAAAGLTAAVSGAVAMAQIQRGASRIYGVFDDRDTVKRYLVATGLMLSTGLLLAVGLVMLGLGSGVGGALSGTAEAIWTWARWPLGILLVGAAIALLFEFAPNRHQPSFSWLTSGGYMATGVWILLTVLLALYLNGSSTFGDTYGPLAGFIGILLWAQLTGIAILFGVAFTAQLEAVRAGVTEPVQEIDRSFDDVMDPDAKRRLAEETSTFET